jgi:hypothetical protein
MKRPWVLQATSALSLLALPVACAGPRVEAPPPPSEMADTPRAVAFAVPRPGTPWPDGRSVCTLFGKVPRFHAYELYRSHDLVDEVASVGSSVPVRWRAFPRLGDPPVARLAVLSPMHLDAFAKLPDGLELQQDVDVIPGHVWLPAGVKVALLGTTADKLVVSLDSRLAAPKVIEAKADCESLVLSDVELRYEDSRSRETRADFELREFSIPLRVGPGGPVLFVFRSPGSVVGEVERSGEFVRIWGAAGNVMLDGYVHEAHLKPWPGVGEGHGLACGVPDESDRCMDRARVVREADVRLDASSTAEPIGKIEASTVIEGLANRGAFYAFALISASISAPPKKHFWIHEADLDPVEDSDGCPPSLFDEAGHPRGSHSR